MQEVRKKEEVCLTPDFLASTTRAGSGDIISTSRETLEEEQMWDKTLGERMSPVQPEGPVRQ